MTVVTLGHIRSHGCRGLPVYCTHGYCHHSAEVNADQWPDDLPVKSLEPLMICARCGAKGADVRPDWRPHTAHRDVRCGPGAVQIQLRDSDYRFPIRRWP